MSGAGTATGGDAPAPAKSFVTRGGQTVFKNTLDSPFRLKWPELSNESAGRLKDELKRSFADLKPQKKKSTKKSTSEKPPEVAEIHSQTGTSPCVEPPSKKQCLEDVRKCLEDVRRDLEDVRRDLKDVRRDLEGVVTASNHRTPDSQHPNAQADQLKEKRSQLVLGVNSVTRELERDGLRAGIVCLSAKPAVLHRHLVMLASTRGVPFAGLKDFSKTVTPLLGVKSALAIGFKRIDSGQDYFRDLVGAISRLSPPINIPWLTVGARSGNSSLEQTQTGPGKDNSTSKDDSSCSKSRETTQEISKANEQKEKQAEAGDIGADKQPQPSQGSSKSTKKRKRYRRRGHFATPQVRYFPQNIKKVAIHPKKRK